MQGKDAARTEKEETKREREEKRECVQQQLYNEGEYRTVWVRTAVVSMEYEIQQSKE